MYIKSENLQALQSQLMITNALLLLMKTNTYDDITITQICQEAEVVRQTFYRNFESKTDILELYLENMFQRFKSEHLDFETEVYQTLKDFFEYLIPHKNFLLLLEKNNLFFLINKTTIANINRLSFIPKIVETIKEPSLDIYALDFITSTICSILSIWVKNDFAESTEMLANLATAFLSGFEPQFCEHSN